MASLSIFSELQTTIPTCQKLGSEMMAVMSKSVIHVFFFCNYKD
jgi:hypothetical protein